MHKICLLLSVFIVGASTPALYTSAHAADQKVWSQQVISPRDKSTGFNAIKSMHASLTTKVLTDVQKKSTAKSLITLITTGALKDASPNPHFFGVNPKPEQTTPDQAKEMIAAIKLTARIDATLQGVIEYFIDHPIPGSQGGHMQAVLKYFKEGVPPVNAGSNPGGAGTGVNNTGTGFDPSQIGNREPFRTAARVIEFDINNPLPFIAQITNQLPEKQERKEVDEWGEENIVQKEVTKLGLLKEYFSYKNGVGVGAAVLRKSLIEGMGQENFNILEDVLQSKIKEILGKNTKVWFIEDDAVEKYKALKAAGVKASEDKSAAETVARQRQDELKILRRDIKEAAQYAHAEGERQRVEAEKQRVERERQENVKRERRLIEDEKNRWDSQTLEKKVQDLKAISLEAGLNIIEQAIRSEVEKIVIDTTEYIWKENVGKYAPIVGTVAPLKVMIKNSNNLKIVDYYTRISNSPATLTFYCLKDSMVVLKIQETTKDPIFIMLYSSVFSGNGGNPTQIVEITEKFDNFVKGIKEAEAPKKGIKRIDTGIF